MALSLWVLSFGGDEGSFRGRGARASDDDAPALSTAQDVVGQAGAGENDPLMIRGSMQETSRSPLAQSDEAGVADESSRIGIINEDIIQIDWLVSGCYQYLDGDSSGYTDLFHLCVLYHLCL